MISDFLDDVIECSNSERLMPRDGQVVDRFVSVAQAEMASGLPCNVVIKLFQPVCKFLSA